MQKFISFFVVVILFTSNAFSQSLNITGPVSPVDVKEGDDFATDELGDPWDFNERRDIGWEENFVGNSINVNGGVWNAVNATPGGYIFPLFPGFARSLFSEGLTGDRTLPKLGINHRINAEKYYHVSYRLNHSSRSTFALYWEGAEGRQEYWPDPESPRGASSDAFYHWHVGYRPNGFNHYSFNLKNLSQFEQKKGSWSGFPYAFRLDPSTGGAAGAVTQLDWMRIVDPNSAPQQTISWNSSNISQFAVVTVHYDTNASGYDGTPLARFTSGQNPGTFTFPTATLPPGDYYFYVTAQLASAGSFTGGITYSGYSARLRISPKPAGFITAPTMTSGEEYSSSVVGNAWDMDSATDVANLDANFWPDPFRQFTNPVFATGNPDSQDGGNIFAAVANSPLPGALESDVQIHLNVSKSKPIETGKFRYLTYRIAIDENQYPTMNDKVSKGWVMRPIWWNGAFTDFHDRAKAHVLYEGWHNYGTDLADPSIIEYGTRWDSTRTVDNLRLDPLETPVPTWFYMDYARLYAENRAATGFYDIKYNITSTGSGSVSTSIYYDTDNSGYNGTLITTIPNQSAGDHTYRWNTSNLPAEGSYFVYVILNNGTSSVKFYSPVHLKIGPYVQAIIKRPDYDFDGDGRSDQLIYRAPVGGGQPILDRKKRVVGFTPIPAGNYFVNHSSRPQVAIPWGDHRFQPLFGDIDGDGVTDKGLLTSINGNLTWYFIRSSNGSTMAKTWGFPGDQIAIADYNGNGTDEIAIYRNGAWWINDEVGNGYVKYWGQPGTDQPVPADYDGDGKADIAIYRKTTGHWCIINSTDGSITYKQWGLGNLGDIGVPSDYNGDGKADVAVFRPHDGTWYVRSLVDDSITVQQWGFPTDIPLNNHDVNGDGVVDFTVYRPSDGTWYYNLRNNTHFIKQYGIPTDLLPIKVSRN